MYYQKLFLVAAATGLVSLSSGKPQNYHDLILTKADFVRNPHLSDSQRQSKSGAAGAAAASAAQLKVPAPFVVKTHLNVKDGVDVDPNTRRGRTYTDQEGATVIEGT